jgi:uncharacterized delta-60 repeat protein
MKGLIMHNRKTSNRKGFVIQSLSIALVALWGAPSLALNTVDSFAPQPNGTVLALAIPASPTSSHAILMGGEFTAVGNNGNSNLVMLGDSGTVDPDWVPPMNGIVRCILVQSDGKILIGGDFTIVDGTSHERLARLNSNGTLDTGFSNPGFNGIVRSIAIDGSGNVLAGGDFTYSHATARGHVARVTSSGALDTQFFDPNVNGNVYSLVLDGTEVVIGGVFNFIGGYSRTYIAKILSNGTLDFAFNMFGSSPNNYVWTLIPMSDSNDTIWAGGQFTSPKNYGAGYNSSGTLTAAFSEGAFNGPVRILAPAGSGFTWAGGSFTCLGNNCNRTKIVRFANTTTSSLDTSFDAGVIYGASADASVNAICTQSNGKIIIGGSFTNVQSQARSYVARLAP